MLRPDPERPPAPGSYHYYKCGAKKRGEKCELKPIPRDHFEDRVIEATVEDMLTRPTILSLFRGLPHASDDLLPEVCGVILGQAFQNALLPEDSAER